MIKASGIRIPWTTYDENGNSALPERRIRVRDIFNITRILCNMWQRD